MGKIFRWIRNHLPTQRRLIQLYAALLHNAHVKGFITGEIYTGPGKMLCVPGLNCYSCPGAAGACPLGALQNALAASGSRAPTYVLGILLLFGLILGRTICGFLCPAGLVQELLHRIPTPKLRKGRFTRLLSWTKYVILVVFVIVVPLWYALQKYPVPAFCKYICPVGTAEGAVGLLAHPGNAGLFDLLGLLFTRKFVLLVGIAVLCVFAYRAFCRFLCPLGAIYGLFAKVAIIGVKVEAPRCTDCGRCVGHCRMDVRRVGDHECIHCGECIDVCPEKAISFRAGKIVLHGPQIADASPEKRRQVRKGRRVAWGVALAVLLAALIGFNLPWQGGAPEESPGEAAAVQTGSAAGDIAPDFTVPLQDGWHFTLSEHRGKTVFLNFWATWCTPCCQELPYFDQLQAAYPQEVVVVAVHSKLGLADMAAYLADYDYRFAFGRDEDGRVMAAYDGSTMLPQTVVIDGNGRIVVNSVGSVTYAQLEALLQQARGTAPAPTQTPPPQPTPTMAPPSQRGPVFGR